MEITYIKLHHPFTLGSFPAAVSRVVCPMHLGLFQPFASSFPWPFRPRLRGDFLKFVVKGNGKLPRENETNVPW